MLTVGGDNWTGSRSGEWQEENPDKESIHALIRELDGKVRTSVTVSIDTPYQYLAIAGGPDLFLVTGERADESIINLMNRTAGPGVVELVCGGQAASFESAQLVDVKAAIAAVDAFLAGFPGGLGPEWNIEK
jgi:hypothetical protein